MLREIVNKKSPAGIPSVLKLETQNMQYADILDEFDLKYEYDEPYLQVGESNTEGWILDISIMFFDISYVLKKLVPVLKKEHIPFKVAIDQETAIQLYSATYGYEQLGKIICIYPISEKQAQELATTIIEFTSGLRGAAIPTDAYLGGTLYTRYGNQINIPFKYPKGGKWPFAGIKKPQKNRRILNGSYLKIDMLKSDIKGNVYLGINIKNWWKFKFELCVIKEGKKDMYFDPSGRTVKDRIAFQYRIQTKLQSHVPVASIIDHFDQDDNAYLVMEYINGIQLQQYRGELSQCRCWWDLNLEIQLKILGYLQQIITIIDLLHKMGYIHRDITPVNFLIQKSGEIRMIDLELCYSKVDFKEDPPFNFGTPGFMSPEQVKTNDPTIKEDIFAIGALMITLIPGLHPTRFSTKSLNTLSERIKFFTKDDYIGNLIATCLNSDPNKRPTLTEVQNDVQKYITFLTKHRTPPVESIENPIPSTYIQRHIHAYCSGKLANSLGLWYSPNVDKPTYVANRSAVCEINSGWYRGIAGVQYVLCLLKENGYDTSLLKKEIEAGWDWLQMEYLDQPSRISPGLYHGSYGLAVSLAIGIRTGSIIHGEKVLGYIHALLSQTTKELSLGKGIAGLGLTTMFVGNYLDTSFKNKILEYCSNEIISRQQKDGSWNFPKEGSPSQTRSYTGFSWGAAGIIFFLCEYYHYSKNVRVKESAIKGMDWLITTSFRVGERIEWPMHPKSKTTDYFLDLGNTGIILCLLKAYERFKISRFIELAEASLEAFPKYIISEQLSLGSGLPGIGLTYLHAYRLTQKSIWHDRAKHICQVILNTYAEEEDGDSIKWYTINSSMPSADFLAGNAGIDYFLLHYEKPHLLNESFIL
ncbi:protein kinase domain-containing protein [Chitinophaga tropicalis]|uniref:Protein kinase n=1 Tax=Chitinophaga tropicalis TaxID=2683588 RepID=A0A7K1TZX6_9BACT|nr:lanthionine synthetase LanC family protein [Chitinophaga tropicalis]MVT07667.1 protein kinase [Chitinophaga tropicalis]